MGVKGGDMGTLDEEPSLRRLDVVAADLADLSRRISEHRAFVRWLAARRQRRVDSTHSHPDTADVHLFDQQQATS
jgi:hypothetical protein